MVSSNSSAAATIFGRTLRLALNTINQYNYRIDGEAKYGNGISSHLKSYKLVTHSPIAILICYAFASGWHEGTNMVLNCRLFVIILHLDIIRVQIYIQINFKTRNGSDEHTSFISTSCGLRLSHRTIISIIHAKSLNNK